MKSGIFIETSMQAADGHHREQRPHRISAATPANPGDTGWDFSNMLLGNYQTFEQSNTYRKGSYHYQSYEWYAQDNWKVRSNLTLDYGMRFSMLKPWYDEERPDFQLPPGLYDPKQQVTLYQPTLVNGSTPGAESDYRADRSCGSHRRHRARTPAIPSTEYHAR